MLTDGRRLAQHRVGPDGSGNANRHTDEEDETPVNGSQNTADNQANERPGYACNLINAECASPLMRWKGVGQDCRAIGEEKSRANALNNAEDDQFDGPRIACTWRKGQQCAANGEDEKTEVIQAHPAKHVGDAAKRY